MSAGVIFENKPDIKNEGTISNSYMKKINEAIDRRQKSDDDWNRLKMHFKRVVPRFFIKLKERSCELTENDLRLCCPYQN